MPEQTEREAVALDEIYARAVMLAASSDPFLKGQYLALLGRITALIAITRGELPLALEDGSGEGN
jgi:hypothetical protein